MNVFEIRMPHFTSNFAVSWNSTYDAGVKPKLVIIFEICNSNVVWLGREKKHANRIELTFNYTIEKYSNAIQRCTDLKACLFVANYSRLKRNFYNRLHSLSVVLIRIYISFGIFWPHQMFQHLFEYMKEGKQNNNQCDSGMEIACVWKLFSLHLSPVSFFQICRFMWKLIGQPGWQ